jgi:hypothetical protein
MPNDVSSDGKLSGSNTQRQNDVQQSKSEKIE